MVNEKQTKRERNIKSKLMAAIAMLLVSSIMMVSTTYAWFTLSTAPEVKGITTSVGANGNLEMALLPAADTNKVAYDTVAKALAGIGSAAGDSMVVKATELSNVTWGNLVDLSPASYGMSNIVLYPSQRPANADKIDLTNAILETPTYGADGRVSNMKTVSSAGIFDFNKDSFYNGGYGVRAVGNVSGMTAREQAFRQALSTAKNAASTANTAASIALNEGGATLGSMAIAVKTGSDNATFTKTQVQALADAFGDLLVKDGAMDLIETSIREYLVAAYVAQAKDTDDYTTHAKGFREDALDEIVADAQALMPTANLSTFTSMITAYNVARAKATEAQTALETLAKGDSDAIAWSSISSYANYLADTSSLKLNGEDMSYWMQTDNEGNYVNAGQLMNSSGLVVTLSSDATPDTESSFQGIYLTIADFTGTVNGSVILDKVSVGVFSVTNVKATMKAATGLTEGAMLTKLGTDVSASDYYKADGTGSAAANPISDFYGYIVDMAFRTNAKGSNLQLQTEGIDRIYNGNTANDATMGGGSTMTFNVDPTKNVGYDAQNVVGLMECIRVIFFNPADGTIYGEARLDASPEALIAGENSFTMPLKMWDSAIENENQTTGNWKADANILALDQNTATAVSMLVYLDGNTIENADVSTANLLGSMNIQFSSTAELTPMEYNDLRTGEGETEKVETYEVKINGNKVAEAKKGASYTFTIPGEFADYEIAGITMGGENVKDQVYNADNRTLTISAVTGAIEITATAPAEPQG